MRYAAAWAAQGAIIGGTVAAAGSVVADAATGGMNIPATPAEIAAGAALGAAAGYALGSIADRIGDAAAISGPLAPPSPIEQAKGGEQKGRNWATEAAKNDARRLAKTPCDVLAQMLKDAKCEGDTKKVRDIEQAQKFMGCRHRGN